MPRLKWSQPALLDVARLHAFLAPKSRDAAQRAVKAIRQGVKALGKHPEIGRPVEEMPLEFREWVIEFGSGAYVALYHYDGKQIVILAIRHGPTSVRLNGAAKSRAPSKQPPSKQSLQNNV